MFSLMLRLTEDNPDMVEWEQEMAGMFQTFMFRLELPVYYKKIGVMMRPSGMKTSSIARWIVATITPSSSTLHHLDIMMKAVNSYFHTTSEGSYSERLCSFFSQVNTQL